MNNISFLKHGLIIDAQGIRFSDSISYDFKPEHRNDFIENPYFHAKLVNATKKNESFLLKNRIELSNNDLKYINRIFDNNDIINIATALLVDETSTNDVFLIIQFSKIELVIEKDSISPSAELIYEVKKALSHYDPYYELLKVFNKYGFFLPKKIILGQKLYRMSDLTVDKNLAGFNHKNVEAKWMTSDDFSMSKFADILNEWRKYTNSYDLDLSYLKEKWIRSCLECEIDSLEVISCKELDPLYEIFDLPLRQEVESVLAINRQIEYTLGINDRIECNHRNNIKQKVLMAGTIQIDVNDPPYLYGVEFPVHFKSNNYQVFGKLITRNGNAINDVIVKFEYMKTHGFLIHVDNSKLPCKDPKIAWILIGIPADVGYFSTNTRKINILGSGDEPFELKEKENIYLNVLENLPQDSIIVSSFKYPFSNYEPNFTAEVQNYEGCKILINILCHNYEPSVNKKNDEISSNHHKRFKTNTSEYSIQWFILQDSGIVYSSIITFYLKQIGQKVYSETKSTTEFIESSIPQISEHLINVQPKTNTGRSNITIISGDKTGVERAALDAALDNDLNIDGWCLKNRSAEDGILSRKYTLKELNSNSFFERDEQNAKLADGILLIITPGTNFIHETILSIHQKKRIIIYLEDSYEKNENQISRIIEWIRNNYINKPFISGPITTE
ncbi:16672_t:CDS:2 [Dentiscutata heterogama]|uniref:16672_t:CDS:1 n=1 Tax=Dentiscutata heterogama TaxID=1316150 RepID=A0ACA9KX28_9GLOM|nr:16672_t:CDS:2 [Dentiscutata heterogama]